MLAAFASFSVPAATAATFAQALAEKRAKCTAEAKQFAKRGREYRTRYRACMARW